MYVHNMFRMKLSKNEKKEEEISKTDRKTLMIRKSKNNDNAY